MHIIPQDYLDRVINYVNVHVDAGRLAYDADKWANFYIGYRRNNITNAIEFFEEKESYPTFAKNFFPQVSDEEMRALIPHIDAMIRGLDDWWPE